MQSLENAGLPNKSSKKGRSETISELAHRHLTDEHHTTTDDELKNAQFELTESVQVDDENLFEVDNTTVIPPLSVERNNTDERNNDDEDNRHTSIANPYNVLGS
ncbi:MAG TPA: hypothetical protein VF610_02610 [Segetibacter sp.]|jgi:hypothetical protein